MQMADKKPLWEVMRDAFYAATVEHGYPEPGYAAELRAIADEVVPREAEPDSTSFAWTGWAARQRIRAKLLRAAAEAEGINND